jgi:hypothetical protein
MASLRALLLHASVAAATVIAYKYGWDDVTAYAPLEAPPLAPQGGVERRRPAKKVNLPLINWIAHDADLQWYGEISVGTPPQKL